jgi:Ala-tRNA(Pro) deacylase
VEQKNYVYEKLDGLGIQYEVIEHPPAFTIEEIDAMEQFKDKPWVAKNLFLRDANKKRHFLVVMDKDKIADLKDIRKKLGTSNLSFSSEEGLMEYLHLTKGSVTPLGIMNDVNHVIELVIDQSLVGRERIGVHPNDNTATVILSYADLIKVIDAHKNIIHIIDL